MQFLFNCCACLAAVLFFGPASPAAPAAPQEIARTETWVSPLWGYNTPKIAYDGQEWFAAGMRSADTKSGEALVYRNGGGGWKELAALPGPYQPPTVGVDGTGRLLVAYTRLNAPVRLMRSTTRANGGAFDALPAPPGMENAYYIGMGVKGALLWLAWIDAPDNTTRIARLDAEKGLWTTPTVLMAGQTKEKPKTAWVYPILYPARDGGLHFAASNAPDGGEGNTYNEVWYLHFPKGVLEPDIRERVAGTVMGTVCFCTDLAEDEQGQPHLAFMHNMHVYGGPLPAGAGMPGLWHARRGNDARGWILAPLGEPGIAGFTTAGGKLCAFLAGNGAVLRRTWRETEKDWSAPEPMVAIGRAPSGPGFLDTLSASSGGPDAPGPAFISDGPIKENGKTLCATWAILPDGWNKKPTETPHEP
jgi:hypothetical protein